MEDLKSNLFEGHWPKVNVALYLAILFFFLNQLYSLHFHFKNVKTKMVTKKSRYSCVFFFFFLFVFCDTTVWAKSKNESDWGRRNLKLA